jgi:hypothetical protein
MKTIQVHINGSKWYRILYLTCLGLAGPTFIYTGVPSEISKVYITYYNTDYC